MLTPFEKNREQSATYAEAIGHYRELAARYPGQLQLSEHGTTDADYPLHTAVLSLDGEFDPAAIRRSGRVVLFINNGIHPGEPEGIDATMMLFRDYLSDPDLQAFLRHVVLVAIPVYNIDGCLNRGSYSRANQAGPEQYGFRGNARNYDLNRDFIKCDTRNAQTFNRLFSTWDPHIFIDNHTSNGADYQYAITIIPTQYNKLEKGLGQYLNGELMPRLFRDMAARKWEMTPYVNHEGETPESGIYGFPDHPRYSTGYASLHHVIGFMPETHMLKPFADRVHSTYAFMDCMIRIMHEQWEKLATLKTAARNQTARQQRFPLQWKVDEKQVDTFMFKGYTAKHKPSEVSGQPRLYFDRTEPYERPIRFWNTYKPSLSVDKPYAYLIPAAYEQVVERLQWNGVQCRRLKSDWTPEVQMYRIRDFKTVNSAYEGHYLHSQVKVDTQLRTWHYRAGDWVVLADQPLNRYIVETLEPQGVDSWFAWNFFDGILMQKEGYSDYVFEDLAADFLRQHPELKKELEEKKQSDPEFAKSARAQLDWVYFRSPWYEPTHRLYPVGRLLQAQAIPVE